MPTSAGLNSEGQLEPIKAHNMIPLNSRQTSSGQQITATTRNTNEICVHFYWGN